MASKKIEENIDGGLWAQYGHYDDDYITAALRIDTEGCLPYSLTYHHGAMPAFDGDVFDTIEELKKAMRELEPDLRKWYTS